MKELEFYDILKILIGLLGGLLLNTLLNFNFITQIISMIVVSMLIFIMFLYSKYYSNNIKRIIQLLEKYEKNKNNENKEREITRKLGELFPKLRDVGFRNISEDTIKNDNFEIHLTRSKPKESIHQFLIRKHNKRFPNDQSGQYLSKKYMQHKKSPPDNNIRILNEFINYLKDK